LTQDLKLRVPFDPGYTARLGVAVYLFAYYEWTIIYIIQYLETGVEPSFVAQYCRGSMMSGQVAAKLEAVIGNEKTEFKGATMDELAAISKEFGGLIDRRNALIHAHPVTDREGNQTLNYQGKTTKKISDMHWPEEEVTRFIVDTDAAACSASTVLDKLRPA
jgi:hypothetical protein